MPTHVLRNGERVPAEQAHVSVFNPAIYGAYGVYESMQSVSGVVFERDAHLARLAESAAILELPLPALLEEIGEWVEQAVAEADGARSHTVRLFVVGPDGSGGNGGSTCFIWAQPPNAYPTSYYEEGVPVITFAAQRFLPRAKSLNSLASYMAQRAARAAGVHEALLHHGGHLSEGSNSNLFAVMDGILVTPPAEDVLSGVTRDLIIDLARGNGLPLIEAPLPLNTVERWTECFITSTSRHVMPVGSVDGAQIGDGRTWPLTRRLAELFEGYFAQRTQGV